MPIKEKSSIELMNMYAEILAELNSRNVVRTYNSQHGWRLRRVVGCGEAWFCAGA